MKKEKAEWVTQIELAKQVNRSLEAVNNWIRRGRIKSKTLENGKRLVDKNSIKMGTRGRPYGAVNLKKEKIEE